MDRTMANQKVPECRSDNAGPIRSNETSCGRKPLPLSKRAAVARVQNPVRRKTRLRGSDQGTASGNRSFCQSNQGTSL